MPSCEGSECLRSGGGCGVCAWWDNCERGVCARARVCVCCLSGRRVCLNWVQGSEGTGSSCWCMFCLSERYKDGKTCSQCQEIEARWPEPIAWKIEFCYLTFNSEMSCIVRNLVNCSVAQKPEERARRQACLVK